MKGIYCVLLCVFTLFFSPSIHADASPQCYKDLGQTFFTYENLGAALGLFQSTQNQQTWSFILGDLNGATRGIHERIRARAAKISPDPTEYPFNKKAAKELLLQELFAIYKSVLVKYNITDEYTMKQTFNYIQNANAARIRACLGN